MSVTYPQVTFPDAELVVASWLRTQVVARVVTSELPADLEDQLPLVQVVRIGGSTLVPLRLDNPRLDVDCYASNRTGVSALARRVAAILPTMRGTTSGGGVVVSVAVETGPSYRPDFNPRVRRSGALYAFTIRPA